MPDDIDDGECPTCAAFQNPKVQNVIEMTVDAFFQAVGHDRIEAGEGMTAAAAAVASIADAIYIGIRESGHDDVSGPEFRAEFLDLVSDYLETLMSVSAQDDEELNEPHPSHTTVQ